MSTKQDHKRWRKEFNEGCLERDGHKCVFCDKTEDLDVHHITDRHEMPNGGYVISNGITLCKEHHLICEQYLGGTIISVEMEGQTFRPYKLYEMIGSFYTKAFMDSLELK